MHYILKLRPSKNVYTYACIYCFYYGLYLCYSTSEKSITKMHILPSTDFELGIYTESFECPIKIQLDILRQCVHKTFSENSSL